MSQKGMARKRFSTIVMTSSLTAPRYTLRIPKLEPYRFEYPAALVPRRPGQQISPSRPSVTSTLGL